MNNIIFIIAGIVVLVSFILLIIDQNYKAKLNENGKYELKVGYGAYLGIIIQLLMMFIMILSAINGIIQKSKMEILFIPIAIILLLSVIYLILETLNHRVTYNDNEITKTNFLKIKSEIEYRNLNSIEYSLFGYGRNLILKDNNGNKIKVYWHLNGFSSLVKFLSNKELI